MFSSNHFRNYASALIVRNFYSLIIKEFFEFNTSINFQAYTNVELFSRNFRIIVFFVPFTEFRFFYNIYFYKKKYITKK